MWVLGRFERELEEAREAFLAGMNELWNITRYNLDGAVAEVEEALIDDSLTGRWRPPRQLSLDGGPRAPHQERRHGGGGLAAGDDPGAGIGQ